MFGRVVYGSSPYGWPQEGTPETVQKLTREDLVKFHDSNYAPDQALLALAGDITPEAAFCRGREIFRGMAVAAAAGCCQRAAPACGDFRPAHLADR